MGAVRNRVIFAEEALFVSPSATGFHYTGVYHDGITTPPTGATGQYLIYGTPYYPLVLGAVPTADERWDCGDEWPPWNPGGTDADYAADQGSVVSQLKRIQSISYGFNTDRTDVNQYGHLARLDAIQLTQAPVNLEFSYYLLDGYNERHIGLVIDGNTFPLATEASGSDGRNYFIETVPGGRDVVSGDLSIPDNEKTVIGIGNGFVTNYSVDLSVNSIPSATVTVEAYNIQANVGTTGINVPAIDPRNGSLMSDAWEDGQPGICKPEGCVNLFSLPPASKFYDGCQDIAALRPGDIVVDLKNASVLSQQVSSATVATGPPVSSASSILTTAIWGTRFTSLIDGTLDSFVYYGTQDRVENIVLYEIIDDSTVVKIAEVAIKDPTLTCPIKMGAPIQKGRLYLLISSLFLTLGSPPYYQRIANTWGAGLTVQSQSNDDIAFYGAWWRGGGVSPLGYLEPIPPLGSLFWPSFFNITTIDPKNVYIDGSAHLQSATIDFPLSRTDLGRVGITNPYTKALDFPITVTLSVSAILADLKKGKLTDLLCKKGNDLTITLYDPSCPGCTRTTSDIALQYKFNQASLISENFSSTIGDNKTVDLVFSTQVG